MKGPRVFAFFVIAGISSGFPVLHSQTLREDVHAADGLEVARIVVTVSSHHDGPRTRQDVIMERTSAAGFTAGDCGVVTTFDVVEAYERWSYRSDVAESIDVTIGGVHYEGDLRPVGVSPLGLNLACIDLSPLSRSTKVTTFPLGIAETAGPLTYYVMESFPHPGTPILNNKREVIAVSLSGDCEGMVGSCVPEHPEFVSGADLERFLGVAAQVPHPRQRLFLAAGR